MKWNNYMYYNPGQTSLGQYCNIHIFLSFLGSLLKQCIHFEIFLHFSLPWPYTKMKLGKNSEYTRPTLFVRWGEGLELWELENAPEMQKCPKTFVHDCLKKRWEEKRQFWGVFQAFKSVFSGFWWKIVIKNAFSQLFGVFWTCLKNSLRTNDIHQKLWYLTAPPFFQRIT